MYADLIDCIYEAASQPLLWPSVLDALAKAVDAIGGYIVIGHDNGNTSFVSESLVPLFVAGQEGGYFKKMERAAPMFEQMPPNFVTDTDLHSVEKMRSMPVYRDFLTPAKMDAGAASVFQGSADDMIVLAIEGFKSHDAARSMLPTLDRLRPHLGRALSLSSRTQIARDQAIVDSLEAMGSGAAIVSRDGTLRAFNAPFEARLGGAATDRRDRLRFADPRADALFAETIAGLGEKRGGHSLVLRVSRETPPCVLHVIPLRRTTRDIFNSDGALLLLADGANRLLPNGDILRLLFDLTPGEARLARALLQEEDLRLAAASTGITYQTARIYLRGIFHKTGTNKQASLLRLLGGYGRPSPAAA